MRGGRYFAPASAHSTRCWHRIRTVAKRRSDDSPSSHCDTTRSRSGVRDRHPPSVLGSDKGGPHAGGSPPGANLSTARQVEKRLEKIILPRIRLVFERPDSIHEIREFDGPRGRHGEVHQWIIQDGHDVRDRLLTARHLDVCPGDAALVAIDGGN